MKEITILEEARLSRLSNDELMVDAIEKASESYPTSNLCNKRPDS